MKQYKALEVKRNSLLEKGDKSLKNRESHMGGMKQGNGKTGGDYNIHHSTQQNNIFLYSGVVRTIVLIW